LEINGKRMRYSETVQPIIENTSSGRLKIKCLRISNKNFERKNQQNKIERSNNDGWNEEKLGKAKNFYKIVRNYSKLFIY
jgi:hypothetical protein